MAIMKKNYTDTYSGADMEYYLSRPAPVIILCFNRDTGKTTNTFGELAKQGKKFLMLTRFKNGLDKFSSDALEGLKKYYDIDAEYNKTNGSITYGTKVLGYISALNSAQEIKTQPEKYAGCEYIVMDEFLPVGNRFIRESVEPGYEWEALKWIYGTLYKNCKTLKIVLLANLMSAANPYFKNIFDSQGVSLLTHLARAYTHDDFQNFTVNDRKVFFSVHIDKSYIDDTPEGELAHGTQSVGIFEDLGQRVILRTPDIQRQLDSKRPILYTGGQALYCLRLKYGLLDGDVYYWVSNKSSASPPPHIGRVDMNLLPHWYSDIHTRCAVADFFRKYNLFNSKGL